MARLNKIPRGTLLIAVTGDPVVPVLERRGDFAALIAEALGPAWSGPYLSIDVREEGALEGLDARDAASLVLTGSASNVHTREPWMLRTEAWLRELVPTGLPVLGICFGHQILAQALGGEVQPNPRGREMSTVEIEQLPGPEGGDDPLLGGLGPRFRVNACHRDTVVRPPPGAVTLARSPLDAHQCLRFARRCYGVQFHPEFDREVMRGFVSERREPILAEGGDPEALWQAAEDAPEGRAVLRRFIERIVSA